MGNWVSVIIFATNALVLKDHVVSIHNGDYIQSSPNLYDEKYLVLIRTYWTYKIDFEENDPVL